MSNSLYFYSPLSVSEMDKVLRAHQDSFDEMLKDEFSEDELQDFESKLDEIAAVYVQPIFSELSFDDFYFSEEKEETQRTFFEKCQSSVCFENLPFLPSNPFQVTYLEDFMKVMGEVLIDRGGIQELIFKEKFLEDLKSYKNLDSLLNSQLTKIIETRNTKSLSPIDFLILDVYKEIDRLRDQELIPEVYEHLSSQSERIQKLFRIMEEERMDSENVLKSSGLIPKDFGDSMERLKFILKKLP